MSRARFTLLVLPVAGLLLLLLAGSGRGHNERTGGDTPGAASAEVVSVPSALATVVVLPDTQYYASSFPYVFAAQARWIVEQESERRIALAIHLGDIVDVSHDQAQWTVAKSSMRLMDGIVPYMLVPGNHDTDANRVGPIDDYFAPATMPWITGTMIAGQIENNYTLVNIGPRPWLILGLEFGPRDAVLAWADGVLKAHPALPAIIVTHAYLDQNGKRYNIAVSGLDASQPNYQPFIPQAFGYTPNETSNDGEQIWQKLILPNPNVRLVLCGHANAAARLTSIRPNASHVHQVMSDYQWLNSGTIHRIGDSGYLRILEFNYAKKEILVRTYSPYLDQSMTDDANQFTLTLDL